MDIANARLLTKIKSLEKRVLDLECKVGIQTVLCAGYCDQPTSDPRGMCQPCREQEQRGFRKLQAIKEIP